MKTIIIRKSSFEKVKEDVEKVRNYDKETQQALNAELSGLFKNVVSKNRMLDSSKNYSPTVLLFLQKLINIKIF